MTTRVIRSLHNADVDRCVDILKHDDGTFGFKEFRRDPEDRGGWTLVSYNPRKIYLTEEEAIAAARAAVVWLGDEPASEKLVAAQGRERMALDAKARETLDKWHSMVAAGDLGAVASLCVPEAVFRSPVAHTPYRGAELVAAFLQNAVQAFSDFRYHRTFVSGERDVVLEFSAKVGDKELKGIDMIHFDELGRIADFEVMVRPATGLQALGAEMARRMTPILAAKQP